MKEINSQRSEHASQVRGRTKEFHGTHTSCLCWQVGVATRITTNKHELTRMKTDSISGDPVMDSCVFVSIRGYRTFFFHERYRARYFAAQWNRRNSGRDIFLERKMSF